MSCEELGNRLRNLDAGQTYSFEIGNLKDEDGNDIDVTDRLYICTAKRDLTLADSAATGANGFQVRYVATAADNTARKVPISVPSSLTAALSGDYHIDVREIVTATPENIVTPVIPLQVITAKRSATLATA